MARLRAGVPPFDSEFRVPCYAHDRKRWRRIAKAAGMNLAQAAREGLALRLGYAQLRRDFEDLQARALVGDLDALARQPGTGEAMNLAASEGLPPTSTAKPPRP